VAGLGFCAVLLVSWLCGAAGRWLVLGFVVRLMVRGFLGACFCKLLRTTFGTWELRLYRAGRLYMSDPQYRALRVVLGFLSLLMAIGGVLLIFGSKALVLRLFLHPPEAEISTLLLATLKEMGGLALMLAIMLFLASRDPVRNVAIIDAFSVGLCILAVTPLLSYRMLEVQKIYPGHLVWGRSLIRLALAAVLYFLRPKKTGWKPVGNF
jgi:hypothetical protein